MLLPPMKFRPLLLPKPWGGDALRRVLGKGSAGDRGMGESWEISDRPGMETVVSEGPLAGTGLRGLLAKHAPAVLGDLRAENGFPLLYKFISAREALSVQVHPGADFPPGTAKTECWYVVEAEPGAELIVGVRARGAGREELLSLLASPRCGEVLNRLPARRGDVFLVPAGTVHAITGGLLLYEVQQNSDTTYRLYDWGRTDAEGRPRALHVEEASAAADLEERQGYAIPPLRVERPTHHEDYLVASPYFALVKWSGFRAPARLATENRFRVITAMRGGITIRGADGAAVPLESGETALVPACQGAVVLEGVTEEAEAIVSFVPDPERDVRAPLRAAGHAPESVARLFGPPGARV